MGFLHAGDISEECDKAAKVLKSFIDKKKIPADVIANAKGLAIFSGFRGGMYVAGAGGSGVVVARFPDGTWSPPSAFSVRSGSVGIVYGFDVYDCVCVLNTQAALDAYTKPEVNLGAVALAAGPMGVGSTSGKVEAVWTYTKSRGLYGGVTVDGTMIKERTEINAKSYGAGKTPAQILRGEVGFVNDTQRTAAGVNRLVEILKQSEGKKADEKIVQAVGNEETPGDMTM
jgi:SH3 domain-containing YSC84-like protein 1